MASSFRVDSLPEYVEQNKGELIAKSVFGANSIEYLTIQTGLKGKTAINTLDVAPVFDDGAGCGFEPQGTTTLSQQYIDPAHLKADMEWCDKDLLNKYAQYQVVSAATGKKLPFEAEIMGQLADRTAEEIEKTIWGGNAAVGTNGLVYIAEQGGATQANVMDTTEPNWAWKGIQQAYLQVKPEVLGKSDLMIYLAVDVFEELVLELVNLNLYHYNPNDAAGEITMPGTNVKIVRCNGMSGTRSFTQSGYAGLIARKSNLIYGLDLDSDSTDIDLWYSKDNKTFRATVEFVIGSGVAFPDEVVLIVEN